MVDPFTAVGTAAAVQELAKTVLAILRGIVRAAADIKDAPVQTKGLLQQIHLAELTLQRITLPGFHYNIDFNLQPILESLKEKLTAVGLKADEFERKDCERQAKNPAVEFTKNFVHAGGSKQKKEVGQLRIDLERFLTNLDTALGADSNVRIVQLSQDVNKALNGSADVSKQLEKIQLDIDSVRNEMLRKSTEDASPAEFQVKNAMILKLTEAAIVNIDDDSCSVKFEYKSGKAWEVPDGVAPEHAGDSKDVCRASSYGGHIVQDGCSLRFTMTLEEGRFFYFVTYSVIPGTEPTLYFPSRSKAKHDIKGGRNLNRIFPNSASFKLDPPTWILNKDGSSKYSNKWVFLIFSREKLVSSEAETKKGVLEISDVAVKLEDHLAKLEENSDFDEIIVKHFKFSIYE